jgi:hypothetical protein
MMGEIVYVQDPPGCVTVTVCPATVTVPLRWTPVVFAATLNDARPLPGPPPLAKVIHEAELDAAQLQAPGVATSTPNVEAADVNATTVGETVKLQTAPSWLMVNVCPAIVTLPVRGVVPGFAATL